MGTTSYEFLGDRKSTDQKAQALRKVPLFKDLDQGYIYAIARHGQDINASPGDVLVRQGEQGRDFILIMDGTVRIEKNGQEIAHMNSGDYFGEMALLDGHPRSATVVAETPASLVAIDHAIFDSLLESDRGLMKALLLTLSDRLRARGEDPVE